MSVELVITLIGALLILIAIGTSYKAADSGGTSFNPKMRILLGLIGIMLVIYGGYSFGAVNLQGQIEQPETATIKQIDYPVEQVQVISPVAGDNVDCRILTMGVYPAGHDKDIWVVLKPSDEKYYPQSDHTNTSYKRNGEWQVITRFGGDQDENYDVIVYETNASASEFFTETIEAWKSALSYPGLEEEELPAGATEVDRITVSLKNNCRGVF